MQYGHGLSGSCFVLSFLCPPPLTLSIFPHFLLVHGDASLIRLFFSVSRCRVALPHKFFFNRPFLGDQLVDLLLPVFCTLQSFRRTIFTGGLCILDRGDMYLCLGCRNCPDSPSSRPAVHRLPHRQVSAVGVITDCFSSVSLY